MKVSLEQKAAIVEVIEWTKDPDDLQLTLGGFAGTGKTTILGVLRTIWHKMSPKMRVAFCAYTGKATRVLNASLMRAGGFNKSDQVSTIHSLIYAPQVHSGQVVGWRKKSDLDYDLIVIDEASMVDGLLWRDLTSFGVPILAVGDHGQLPPIEGSFNLMNNPDIVLEQIHRQAEGSPIIQISQLARETGEIPVGDFGMGVKKLSRYDSANAMIVEEMLTQKESGLMILAGYNHTRVKLNAEARRLRDIYSEDPVRGDVVICLRNDWERGIFNGMIGLIESISPYSSETEENLKLYEAVIILEDGEEQYRGLIFGDQFGASSTLSDIPREVDGQPLALFDFGYALTVHKSQGGQAPNVLLFEERNKHMSDDDWRRWLYTGVTRATEQLVIVGT